MYSTYLIIIILAILSGLTTIIGVVAAFCCRKSSKAVAVGIGFSTGIMLLISFFELVPEALEEVSIIKTIAAVIAGGLMVFLLDLIIPHTHFIKDVKSNDIKLIKVGYLVAFGLILHDFPEGFAMANSYLSSPSLGLLLAVAIALHNIPEEFAMTIPMVAKKSKSFLVKLALISGLAEPAGAIAGIFFVHFFRFLNPYFLAGAAGAMIFICGHELFPMAKRYEKTSLFITGIILSVIVYLGLNILLPE